MVFFGVGGVFNVVVIVVVINWFNEKCGFVFGIMEVGFGVG